MPVSGTFINFGGTRLSTMERPCAFSYRAPKQKLEHAVGDAEKRLEIILFFFRFLSSRIVFLDDPRQMD